MKGKHVLILIAIAGFCAACGSADESQPATTTTIENDFICWLDEHCTDPRQWCQPSPPDSGILTCDGADMVFITACEVGYYCDNQGNTPYQFPRCLALDGTILRCDVEDSILKPE